MATPKRFYWIKLGQSFFEDEVVSELEKMGAEYAYFYVKLLTISAEFNGKLIRVIGKRTFKHRMDTLAELTRTPVKIVKKAMEFLIDVGMIEETAKAHYMVQITELVGSESESAARMRKMRASQRDGEVTPKCEKVTDSIENRDKSIEEREKIGGEKKKYSQAYGTFSNVYLTNEEYQDLKERYANYKALINNLSVYMNSRGIDYGFKHYEKIIEWAVKDGEKDMRVLKAHKEKTLAEQAEREARLEEKWQEEHPPLPEDKIAAIKKKYGIA